MARSTKTTPTGAVTDSAPNTPPAGQPGPVRRSAARRPGSGHRGRADGRPRRYRGSAGRDRRDHPRGCRAGAGRPGEGRPRHPGPERVPGHLDSPERPRGGARNGQPGGPRLAAQLLDRRGRRGSPGHGSTRRRDPDPEEDTGSAAPVDPAGIAPGAGEALGSAAAAAAQAEAALQAGDLAGALAAADHLTQAAARTQRLLRDAGLLPAAGRRLGRRPANCAAWSPRSWPPTRPRTSARTRSAGSWAGQPARWPTPWTA